MLLMWVINTTFISKRFDRTLPEVRLDPSDVAQDVLMFLTRKTPKIRLEHPEPKVLLQVMYTAIYRYVCSAASESKRKTGEVAASDYYSAGESDGLDGATRSDDSACAIGVMSDPDEAEDYVIGGIVASSSDEAATIEKIWLWVSDRFCQAGEFPAYRERPDYLVRRKDCTHELHALILSRFVKYLRDSASVTG